MPGRIGILGNKPADQLAKEARKLNDGINSQITFDGANAIARFRLRENTTKKDSQVCETNANRNLTKTITR